MGKVVVHLIVGLDKAGAETMLYQILKNSHCNNIYKVVSMGKGNYYKPYIENLGIEVLELNMKQHPFKSIGAAKKILKAADTLCCWMYHSNLVGYLAAKHLGIKKIIWCIRHSDLSPAHNKRRTLFINNICARFSRNVSLILYNGKRARKVHEAVGYCKERGVITDNGCDTNEYKFDPEARTCLLKELNIQPDKKILLSVTRDAPIKDVPTFLEAFVRVHKKENDTIAVLCGSGITVENEKITEFCKKKGIIIEKDIFLLGLRNDIPKLMSACDLYVLHSAGEAFPNTLIQAMSCETLCITTDVGDARRIIGDEECVVQPKNPIVLSKRICEMFMLPEHEKKNKRKKNRNRVCEKYDIRNVVKQYEEFF